LDVGGGEKEKHHKGKDESWPAKIRRVKKKGHEQVPWGKMGAGAGGWCPTRDIYALKLTRGSRKRQGKRFNMGGGNRPEKKTNLCKKREKRGERFTRRKECHSRWEQMFLNL